MSDSKSAGCSFNLAWLVVAVLAYFKLTTHPGLSWWWVFAPVLVPSAIALLILFGIGFVALVALLRER